MMNRIFMFYLGNESYEGNSFNQKRLKEKNAFYSVKGYFDQTKFILLCDGININT